MFLVSFIGKITLNMLSETGRSAIFLFNTLSNGFTRPFYFKAVFIQIIRIGYNSLPVIGLTAFFTGGALALQIYVGSSRFNAESMVASIVALGITRELGPVIAGLMLAGRVSASIAAEIATMRVTEQIDALEVMGINSVNYLVFPKTVALLLYPFVISIAMFLGIIGGMAACVFGGYSTFEDYVTGVQMDFMPFHMVYAFIKTLVFAFLLATIPSFHGYYMKGGALEVGKASTTAFVWTSVAIILLNYILTQMLLS